MNLLSATQAAYIAGIFDGEGTITINRTKQEQYHNWSYTPNCFVTNTNEELLHWLRNSTRVGRISESDRYRKENHKRAYRWKLYTKEVRQLLEAIQPFLVIKKRQAEIILEFLPTMRYNANQFHPYTEQELEKKLELYYEIANLNQRGL
jgi:hypothetical protein